MTEEEWLECSDPPLMLTAFRGKLSARKKCYFGCVCCRRVWHLLNMENRKAVESIEKFADGEMREEELMEVCRAAYLSAVHLTNHQASPFGVSDLIGYNSHKAQLPTTPQGYAAGAVLCMTQFHTDRDQKADFAVRCVAGSVAYQTLATGHQNQKRWHEAQQSEFQAQADILRDIFGNPFRPVVLDPRWLTETVVALASGIYEERAFDRMPILADALEDAGCDHADILAHCRGDGPHVRGCWVVDLLLGKE